jgi:uncharacterized membrane protein YcgQ (UPF0703/DUF1980 family)
MYFVILKKIIRLVKLSPKVLGIETPYIYKYYPENISTIEIHFFIEIQMYANESTSWFCLCFITNTKLQLCVHILTDKKTNRKACTVRYLYNENVCFANFWVIFLNVTTLSTKNTYTSRKGFKQPLLNNTSISCFSIEDACKYSLFLSYISVLLLHKDSTVYYTSVQLKNTANYTKNWYLRSKGRTVIG